MLFLKRVYKRMQELVLEIISYKTFVLIITLVLAKDYTNISEVSTVIMVMTIAGWKVLKDINRQKNYNSKEDKNV